MPKNNKSRMTGWSDYITSTISVTLVIFILGLVGIINITFNGLSRHVKENMGFTIVLTDSIDDASIQSLKAECDKAPYISSFKYLSAEQVLNEETNGQAQELVDLLGVNPYSAMIEVKMKERYAEVDSISRLLSHWEAKPQVDEVTANTEMIGNLSHNARLLNTVLIIIAAALLLISLVLINNTVRLTVYARRFLIHTMKLVGAKGSFIRRPFMIINAIQGFIAGLLAVALLCGLIAWSHSFYEALTQLVAWSSIWYVMVMMVVLGIIICMVAAAIATNRYLRKDYDAMFD